MRVYAVIVTYGNRFHLLKQVVDSALAEGVTKVIVVDNNSVAESKDKLKEYEKELGNQKIKVLYLNDNYGSAGGYKRGLEEAYNDPECEFIWLLDDDNKPLKNSLNVLKEYWDEINIQDKESKIALLSWRPKQGNCMLRAIDENNPELTLGSETNKFLNFSILDIHKKLYKIFKRAINFYFNIKVNNKYKLNHEKGVIANAYYGGLFINKKIINDIGYPNEKFIVYVDDVEWTYRITKNRKQIIACLKSQLDDLEVSWYATENYIISFEQLIKEKLDFRIYYSIRNRVYFETNNLVTSKILYMLNMYVFKSILLILSLLYGKLDRYKLINKAIQDGLDGRLGRGI